jgi:hypothetical protein
MTVPRPHFPDVQGSNLEGTRFNLPHDLKGVLNIVIIAFKREQASLLEKWGAALNDFVERHSGLAFYELPVLSLGYSPLRWWIDGGMKAGILEEESRKRTITIYTNKRHFKLQLGIPNEETVYVFLIDNMGKILWRTEGEFTNEKLEKLQSTANAALLSSAKGS